MNLSEYNAVQNKNACVCLSLRLVGGLETLDAMEKVEVDKKDKPKVWWVDRWGMGGEGGGFTWLIWWMTCSLNQSSVWLVGFVYNYKFRPPPPTHTHTHTHTQSPWYNHTGWLGVNTNLLTYLPPPPPTHTHRATTTTTTTTTTRTRKTKPGTTSFFIGVCLVSNSVQMQKRAVS